MHGPITFTRQQLRQAYVIWETERRGGVVPFRTRDEVDALPIETLADECVETLIGYLNTEVTA